MTLRGIDVSNWDSGLKPHNVAKLDFCICKATEGVSFTDQYMQGFIDDCKAYGILYGYYHFAGKNTPEREADYFWSKTKHLHRKGIPVLDYETWEYNRNHVAWCERFIKRYYAHSKVWPLLYISAGYRQEFEGSFIVDKCGLWAAGGNSYDSTNWIDSNLPFDPAPWDCVSIWQFTECLDAAGYDLDADYAYMDKKGWLAYAGVQTTTQDSKPVQKKTPEKAPKTCEELAKEVIAGKWGNGWNRQNALDSVYGPGTYNHVQEIVNRMVG